MALMLLFLFSTVVHWHFMSVMFSLYNSMKEEEFRPSAQLNLAEAGELEKKSPPPPYVG